MIRQVTATASIELKGHINDSMLFLANYALRMLRVAALLSVWRMAMHGRASVAGMSLPNLLTYTLIAEVFAEQLAARTCMDWVLWEGQLVTVLLRPMGMLTAFFSISLGWWTAGWIFCSIPLLLISPLLGVNPAPSSVAGGFLFVPSLVLAIAVGWAIDFLFVSVGMALNSGPWVVQQFREAVTILLSGALIPLAALPWNLASVFDWLPFASMASAPLRIYTGAGNPLQLMAIQAVWAVVLWPTAVAFWRANREKVAGYGG